MATYVWAPTSPSGNLVYIVVAPTELHAPVCTVAVMVVWTFSVLSYSARLFLVLVYVMSSETEAPVVRNTCPRRRPNIRQTFPCLVGPWFNSCGDYRILGFIARVVSHVHIWLVEGDTHRALTVALAVAQVRHRVFFT